MTRLSMSLPRIGDVGLSNVRLWGGPNPRSEQQRQERWGQSFGSMRRKPSLSKGSKDDGIDRSGMSFKSIDEAAKAMGLNNHERRHAQPTLHPSRSLPDDELRDAGPSGPRPFPGPLAGPQQHPHPSQGYPQDFMQHPYMAMPPPPGPTEDQRAILAAVAALSSQLEEHQRREQEREMRFEELTQRMAEPTEEAQSSQRQRDMDVKEQEIHRANREAQLDALLAALHAKSEQQDALLKKIAAGAFIPLRAMVLTSYRPSRAGGQGDRPPRAITDARGCRPHHDGLEGRRRRAGPGLQK
jgi:hypothetical protein